MPLTLTDEQVAEVRRRLDEGERNKQIAEFTAGIWNDPKLSDRAKALAKEKYPETQIGDYDAKMELRTLIDGFKQEREDERKKVQEDERTAFYARQKTEVQKQYGFTDEAMDRMTQEMQDKHVYDYEVMAPHFASRQPRPVEEVHPSNHWNHHKTDKFKEIVNDPEDYAFTEIVNAIQADETRARERR